MSSIEILSPEGPVAGSGLGAGRPATPLAARPRDLAGRRIALHDNAKPGARDLLAAIGSGLSVAGATCRGWSKAHAARPSPHVADMAAAVQGAVFALGD